MSITVYWSCLEEESLRATEPDPVLKNFYKSKYFNESTGISKCPSFNNYFDNTFYLRSIYDYNFSIDEKTGNVSTQYYDQNFFDSHVLIRNMESRMFSFHTRFIFFTEEKSLLMSLEQPMLSMNNSINNVSVIPGSLDIGKWYRALDFAFFMNEGINKFSVKEGDPFYQIKFHTQEKINFVRFFENENLKKYSDLVQDSRNNHKKVRDLNYYYSIFSLKKRIIQNIKNNTE